MLCLSNNRTLCCRQIIKTITFQSNQNKRNCTIYHNVNCKSKYTIYLIECTNCKLQYVGKAETELILRINNHSKDVLKLNAIPADLFQHWRKVFCYWTTPKHKAKKIKHHGNTQKLETFRICKLETLCPKGLNHELNWQISSYAFFSA